MDHPADGRPWVRVIGIKQRVFMLQAVLQIVAGAAGEEKKLPFTGLAEITCFIVIDDHGDVAVGRSLVRIFFGRGKVPCALGHPFRSDGGSA